MAKIWKSFLYKFLLFIFLIFFTNFTALVCSAVRDNAYMSTRIYHGLITGIFVGVPYALVLFTLLILSKNKYRVILPVGVCVWIVFMVLYFNPPSPSRLFRRVVKSPIPESVKDIRISLSFAAHDHLYILNYKISEKDLEDILNSKGFHSVQYHSYDDGVVKYRDSAHHTFPVNWYKQPPSWFKLQLWHDPEMYAVEIERGYEQLLIYNSNLMEAYFIDYKR